MRTSTAAWAAALAVMSMRGPFTTAQAAPAQQDYAERPRHFSPKHIKRGYNETATPHQRPPPPPPATSDESTIPLPTSESTLSSPKTRHKPKPKTKGRKPSTDEPVPESPSIPSIGTATETITYTDTTSSLPTVLSDASSAIPLTSSISVPASSGSIASSSSPEPLNLPKHGPIRPPEPSDVSLPEPDVAPSPGDSPSEPTEALPPTSNAPYVPFKSNSTYSVPSPSSSVRPEDGVPLPGQLSDIIPTAATTDSSIDSSTLPIIPLPTPSDQQEPKHGENGGRKHGSKHSHDEDSYTASSRAVGSTGSTGGLIPDLLPTPSAKPSDDEDPPFPFRPKRPNVLGTGTPFRGSDGTFTFSDPTPTPGPNAARPSGESVDSSSSSGLLVGVNTVLSNGGMNPDTLTSEVAGLTKSDGTRTAQLTEGLTGPATGLPTVLPTGDRNTSDGTGANESSTEDKTDDGLLPLTDSSVLPSGLTGVGTGLTDVTSKVPIRPTGALPTGVNSIVPTGVFPGTGQGTGSDGKPTKTDDVGGIISSVKSEVTQQLSDIPEPTDITSGVPPVVPAVNTHPLSRIRQSLDSKLSDIKATETDPAIVSSVESGFTSILTDAASTLSTDVPQITETIESNVPTVKPVGTGTGTDPLTIPNPTEPLPTPTLTPTPPKTGAIPTDSVELTVTGGGTSAVVTVPTPGKTPGLSDNTSTDSSESPSALPEPDSSSNDTPQSKPTPAESLSESTPAETYSDSESTSGSTKTTKIPLTTGATVPLDSSTASPSSYATPDTPKPTPPASEPVESEEPTKSTLAPHTIQPTGTDTLTSMTIPTEWTFAPRPSVGETKSDGGIVLATSTTSSASEGLPTYMPKLVQPPGGMPNPAPVNATLVQLGFNFGLNFPFVVGEADSASQIFEFLPQGIAYGLGCSHSRVVMNGLMPYDTSNDLNFITTLAQAYVPSEMVTRMQLDLHSAASAMYSNPNDAVRTLMNMINPTIPILPGASMGADPSASAYNPAATVAGPAGEAAPIGGDSGSANKVKGKSVGIVVGACAGAAVYAAAMIYVARRYRQKKKMGHQRASSVNTAPQMSSTPSGGMGGFFMSGANGRGSSRGSAAGSAGRGSRTSAGSSNGRSVREQGISAPLASENSLGWN